MDNITNIQEDNLGGIHQVRFAPVEFFASTRLGTFKAGRSWITVECNSETFSFTERGADDNNGGYHDTTIAGSIPKIRPEISVLIKMYSRRPVIVETKDNNGYLRRSGLSGRIIMLDQASTGTDASDTNGYQLQFAGRQRKPSDFIQ